MARGMGENTGTTPRMEKVQEVRQRLGVPISTASELLNTSNGDVDDAIELHNTKKQERKSEEFWTGDFVNNRTIDENLKCPSGEDYAKAFELLDESADGLFTKEEADRVWKLALSAANAPRESAPFVQELVAQTGATLKDALTAVRTYDKDMFKAYKHLKDNNQLGQNLGINTTATKRPEDFAEILKTLSQDLGANILSVKEVLDKHNWDQDRARAELMERPEVLKHHIMVIKKEQEKMRGEMQSRIDTLLSEKDELLDQIDELSRANETLWGRID